MGDNKLSWTELRRTLASRAGVSEKEANTFLNTFNEQLVAALKSDKQVRVNGLGTFKLQAVAPRKSVNVTTGEEITIEGYNKIAFVPEAGVKELVEGRQPSAVSEANEPIDPLKKLGMQAEEIVDILGELGQMKEEVVEPEPVVEPEKPEKPVEPEKPEKPKKEYHFMRDTLICVVILLMLLLGGYFFFRSQLGSWIDELVNPREEIRSEKVENEVQREEVQREEVQRDEVQREEVQRDEVQSTKEEEEWTFDEILVVEEITEGSRLAWLAKKHYGDKAYWPYIYAANKEQLPNPSLIPVGTPIRVPKLNAAMRDTTDERFLRIREEARRKIGN